MKKLLILILALGLIGCKADDGANGASGADGKDAPTSISITITGAAQKGPYQAGTQVSVQGLDSSFTVIAGENASTTVQDDLGNFSSALSLPQSTYGDILACGYFFDELAGAYTQERFCSSSILIPNAGPYNLNIATSMMKEQIKELVSSGVTGQASFDQASKNLIREILGFNEGEYPSTFTIGANNWVITDNSPLLAISSLLLGGSIQELESKVTTIANDMVDGSLAQSQKDTIKQKAISLNVDQVTANVNGKFTDGAKDINRWLAKLDPSRLVNISHTQGRGTMTNSTNVGGAMWIGIPFKPSKALAPKYASVQCPILNAEIWTDGGGNTLGTKVDTGTAANNTLPLRNYSDGSNSYGITANQATFNAPSLSANVNYWLVINMQPCNGFWFYEAAPHSKVIRSNDGGNTYTLDFNGWTGTPVITFLE